MEGGYCLETRPISSKHPPRDPQRCITSNIAKSFSAADDKLLNFLLWSGLTLRDNAPRAVSICSSEVVVSSNENHLEWEQEVA